MGAAVTDQFTFGVGTTGYSGTVDGDLLTTGIFEHGIDGRFYSQVRKYHHEAGKVYWSMANAPEGATLINRCEEYQTFEARLAAGTLPRRTGTVAACWLVEQGLSADDALARVQLLRWGKHEQWLRSPEADEQCDFVRGWQKSDRLNRRCPSPLATTSPH